MRCFLTFSKSLTMCGMMKWYLSSFKTIFKLKWLTFYRISLVKWSIALKQAWTIYQMILKVNGNYLTMIHIFFVWIMALILLKIMLIMIYRKIVNGISRRKWSLIPIQINKLKKQYRAKSVSINLAFYFNNTAVNSTVTHKYLGRILDSKPSFDHHLPFLFSRVNKTIGFFKITSTCSSTFLSTLYKSFLWYQWD